MAGIDVDIIGTKEDSLKTVDFFRNDWEYFAEIAAPGIWEMVYGRKRTGGFPCMEALTNSGFSSSGKVFQNFARLWYSTDL
jgi:hypothetical protein